MKSAVSELRFCSRECLISAEGVSCNFESGFCGWEQEDTDSFDWTRRSGRTPSYLTGPYKDHTTETGDYKLINERNKGRYLLLIGQARGPYWVILTKGRGSTDQAKYVL